ncbi:hypothetical protein [Crocinitomix algicola]|uniref:hypothetical protein n=1 Tax=Crocinitomix algicola TaxID=1740263 RepID=UPI000829F8E9|nr:hypothetical protein [Crocinitomix algicola]
MKFTLSLTLSLLLSSSLFAQNFEELIPNTAEFVFKVDGAKIADKIGQKKIEKSDGFNAIIRDFFFRGNEDLNVKEMGIDVASDLLVFFNADTSMEYIGVLYGVENSNLFEKYIRENAVNDTLIKYTGFNALYFEDNYSLLAWNDEFALYLNIDYLHESLKPLSNNYSNDYSYYPYSTEQVEEVIEYEVIEETSCDDGDIIEVEPETEVYQVDSAEIAAKKAALEAEERRKKAERMMKLRQAYHNTLLVYFKGANRNNILTNEGYTSNKNDEGDLYFWFERNQDLSSNGFLDYFYYSGRRYYRKMMMSMGSYFGDEISINALFNEKNIELLGNVDYSANIAQYFNEIYKTNISPKIWSFVSDADPIAINAFSLNAEKLWKYYPKMYAEIYSSLFSRDDRYKEEVEVLLDFIDIFMDEEALGKILLGDGIIMLEDLVQTEVKYTSYEYTEDYSERYEVEKTKTEIRPQFMGLFTTGNKAFLEKLLGLAVKNEVMYRGNQYYYTSGENRDLPFQIGFTIQNDVLIIGTDLKKIEGFAEGNKTNGTNKIHRNKIEKNQGYLSMNIQKLLEQLPNEEFRGKELELLEYARKNTRRIEAITNLKESRMKSNVTIEIPKKAKNGAVYLWDFMNELYAIEKNQ